MCLPMPTSLPRPYRRGPKVAEMAGYRLAGDLDDRYAGEAEPAFAT